MAYTIIKILLVILVVVLCSAKIEDKKKMQLFLIACYDATMLLILTDMLQTIASYL